MRLIDTHCHLDFPELARDRDAVLARAAEAGVARMITICTEVGKFPASLPSPRARRIIFCSVGTHPNHAQDEREVSCAELVALAAHPKCVAIGETGLDYHYNRAPRDLAHRVFRAHIAAARETGLPLVIHSRDADEDMAAILREETAAGPFKALLHCFTSSRELAEAALALGAYISFSGVVTFKNSRRTAQDRRNRAAGAPAGRNRRALPRADAPSRQDQRAGLCRRHRAVACRRQGNRT